MSIRGMMARAKKLAASIERGGGCDCPTGPKGQSWYAGPPLPDNGEDHLRARCGRCGGSYRILIEEEVVTASEEFEVDP